LDPAEVIRTAITSRDLAGSRDVAAVLDARTAPSWAVSALGPVPAGSAACRHWEDKAAPVAAYREMYGYHHPDDPIGPEPARQAPDQRAAWHEAFAALGPAGQPDVRALPDGQLWLTRDAYAA
jgi:hypothetical protein